MACDIISGYTRDCRDSKGGLATIYITELANKDTIVKNATGGIIETFDLTTGKQFWEYELILSTSNFTSTGTVSRANGTDFAAISLTVELLKQQQSTIQKIKLIAKNDIMVIAKDRNGKYWLLGENNGLSLTTDAAVTGTAMGDKNGYTLTFAGEEEERPSEVDASLIAALLIPAV